MTGTKRYRVRLYADRWADGTLKEWCICDYGVDDENHLAPILRLAGPGHADCPRLFTDRAEAERVATQMNACAEAGGAL